MTFSESMEHEHSSIYDLACSLLFWLFLALVVSCSRFLASHHPVCGQFMEKEAAILQILNSALGPKVSRGRRAREKLTRV